MRSFSLDIRHIQLDKGIRAHLIRLFDQSVDKLIIDARRLDQNIQMCAMSTEEFEDLYFNVCNLDYSKMERAMTPPGVKCIDPLIFSSNNMSPIAFLI